MSKSPWNVLRTASATKPPAHASASPSPRSAASTPPNRDRQVHVTLKLDRASIRDEGPGSDVNRVEQEADDPENLMRIGGRGLLLIRTFMDEITPVKRRTPDPTPFDHP